MALRILGEKFFFHTEILNFYNFGTKSKMTFYRLAYILYLITN